MSTEKRPLKIIQIGTSHEHASGKYASLKLIPETFELLGYVDDLEFMDTPRYVTELHPTYQDGRKKFTLEEALSYPGLDAVAVEVPNLELVKIGKMCAERKIAIHLDKPAGENMEDYAELLELCKKNRVPLQMGYMYRGNPALSYVRELIRNKVIGEVFEASLDMNHGYGNAFYDEYIASFKGGIMFNLGCHLVDFVLAAMGEPVKVTPFITSVPGHPAREVNNMLAVLQYPNAFVKLTACSGESGVTQHRRWTFAGTNGYININPPERFDGKGVEVTLFMKKAHGLIPRGNHVFTFPPQRDRYVEQLLEFAQIIRNEIENPYTYAHDSAVHKVTLAASGYTTWEK
ncbi:MAG: Gfo/Idh/MocA family oxidoreductase [Lentisphaeria bacterium]|nr:Gfo/Idh/MocA family oxidoreductase [Lentisphaeria bacterium]